VWIHEVPTDSWGAAGKLIADGRPGAGVPLCLPAPPGRTGGRAAQAGGLHRRAGCTGGRAAQAAGRRAAGPPGRRAAGLPGRRAAGLPGCRAAEAAGPAAPPGLPTRPAC
jgi:hypothetical protein